MCRQKMADAGERVLTYSAPVKTLFKHLGRCGGAQADLQTQTEMITRSLPLKTTCPFSNASFFPLFPPFPSFSSRYQRMCL